MRFGRLVTRLVILSGGLIGLWAVQANEITIRDHSQAFYFKSNEAKWDKAFEGFPKGAEMMVLEGDPKLPGQFIMRVKLPAHYQIPAHWTLSDSYITVISGHLNLGTGDTLDLNKGKDLKAGSYARIPAKMHHYAWCNEDSVIQIQGQGPWDISYLNPTDDPRGNTENLKQEDDFDHQKLK